jgi:hypothetical protein
MLAALAGCRPEIGDRCRVSTDCSTQNDRVCDVSQPDGYCTQLNCQGNACPNEAACVLFNSAIPGCGFDDRSGPFGSRIARSYCSAKCDSNGDCRDGYVCADPRSYPWSAVILDNNQNKRTCLPIPLEGRTPGPDAGPEAQVCGPATLVDAGTIEASAPNIQEAGSAPPLFPDAGSEGLADAQADGG